MFHIGVATQHPPLPEPGQLSELGINFIKQCLIIDPMKRPSAEELMNHPWMLEFRATLLSYEEVEMTSPPEEMPPEDEFELPTIARQSPMIQIEGIGSTTPDLSPPSDYTSAASSLDGGESANGDYLI